MKKKKQDYRDDPELELAASRYRTCILSSNGDLDDAERLLNEIIRPPCKELMRNYGIAWNSVLERFLCTVLLYFDRYDGKSFLSFFLLHAKNNFDLPSKPINTSADYHGTGLTPFLQTWESQPERHTISRVDRETQRGKKAERRAAADPEENNPLD